MLGIGPTELQIFIPDTWPDLRNPGSQDAIDRRIRRIVVCLETNEARLETGGIQRRQVSQDSRIREIFVPIRAHLKICEGRELSRFSLRSEHCFRRIGSSRRHNL